MAIMAGNRNLINVEWRCRTSHTFRSMEADQLAEAIGGLIRRSEGHRRAFVLCFRYLAVGIVR